MYEKAAPDERRVTLRPVDEDTLAALLAVAVADAEPEEVMPPVPGPPGWTAERQEAFRAWHRARRPGFAGPHRERTYAVLDEGRVVGSARLARVDQGDGPPGGAPEEGGPAVEVGLWLGRSARGRGVGTAALRRCLDEAAAHGLHMVVAETTSGNAAALAALRHNAAHLAPGAADGEVHARLHLHPDPDPEKPHDIRSSSA